MKKPTHDERTEAIRISLGTLKKVSAKGGAPNYRVVMKVAVYVLLMDDDLAYFTEDLVVANTKGRRAFLAKNEATLLFETLNDLRGLLGKEFRKAVVVLGTSPELLARLNAVSSEINAFYRNHRAFLGDIRNSIAAHRKKDSLAYSDALERLEPLRVMECAAEFSELLRRLADVLIDFFGNLGPQAMAQDILRGIDAARDNP